MSAPRRLHPPLAIPSTCRQPRPRHWLVAIMAATLIAPAGFVQIPASWSLERAMGRSGGSEPSATVTSRLATINDLARMADAGQELPIPPAVIAQLVEALRDSDAEVRLRAIDALNGIGSGAEDAIPALVEILRDSAQPADLRRHAVIAIRGITAGLALEPLNRALQDPDRLVRSHAAGALGSIRERARLAVPQLLLLLETDPYSEVRASSAQVLGMIDSANPRVWAALDAALLDRSWVVRRYAAEALAEVGPGAKKAVPNLLRALDNKNFTLRTYAAKTLGKLGPGARSALPDLKEALLHNNNTFAQAQAAGAIGNIGTDDPEILKALISGLDNSDAVVREQSFEAFHKLIHARMDQLFAAKQTSVDDLDSVVALISKAQVAVEAGGFPKEKREMLQASLDLLQAKRAKQAFISTVLLNQWSWLIWLVAVGIGLQFTLFWLRPLWLLKLDQGLRSIAFKVPLLGTEVPLQKLLFLTYHERVLDAWVAWHVDIFQQEFSKLENVEARKVYIPSPATIDGRTVSAISQQDLDPLFIRPVLIWGEGGVGKTSLACQLAEWAMADKPSERLCKHRMLPILLEEDLECAAEACEQSLLDTILGQLRLLTHEDLPISKELLENLLRRRRIMVIADHLSEMNAMMRKAIDPDNPAFPINALIVTSRQRDVLGQVNKLVIKPLRIMGNRLSSFMEAYLTQQGKRDLFTDSEFFDACSHLSRMVGQREVTAMLATLYAKQMISAKVEAAQDISTVVSDTIPDLMLSYLNQINKELGESRTDQQQLDDRTVHKDAMIVAWHCVKELFRPSVINRETAIAALAELRGDQAEAHLRYLEERLLLIQTVGASKDQIRFSLDPLAEYLAALHLVELYDGHDGPWLEFLSAAETKPDSPVAISGLLTAVQDCWECKGKTNGLSAATLARLTQFQTPTAATVPTISPAVAPLG